VPTLCPQLLGLAFEGLDQIAPEVGGARPQHEGGSQERHGRLVTALQQVHEPEALGSGGGRGDALQVGAERCLGLDVAPLEREGRPEVVVRIRQIRSQGDRATEQRLGLHDARPPCGAAERALA